METQKNQLRITPESEISHRISCLKKHMADAAIQAVFLTHKPDIFYFSGTAQDCYLYLSREHDPVLFVKRYFPRAQKESRLKHIFEITSIKKIPEIIVDISSRLPSRCGLTFDVLPVRDFLFFQKLFHGCELVDCTEQVSRCRQIKSEYEILLMKEAARLSKRTYHFIEEHIRPGISEMEFAGEFETFARRFGHSGLVLNRYYRAGGYPFHLLSGKNGGLAGAIDTPCCGTGTSVSHPSGAGAKLLEENEPVLIDFSTILNGYHIDETRMFAIKKMSEKALDASRAAIDILHTLLSIMKPGTAMGEIYEKAVSEADRMGFSEQFLGLPDLKSIFIGHGTGIELVENPVISKGRKEVLQPGMTLAVEPKFIFKNRFAAGIESVVQITEKSACFLSSTENKIFIC